MLRFYKNENRKEKELRNKTGIILWVTAFSFLTGCGAAANSINISNNTENLALENQNNQENHNIVLETDVEVTDIEVTDIEVTDVEVTDAGVMESETYAWEDKEDNLKKKRLTLDRVLELSRMDHLDWSDFDDYISEDIGFGLYILKFDIDDNFYLLVGGTGEGEPMYVRLVSAKDKDKYINIISQNGKEKGNTQKDGQDNEGVPVSDFISGQNQQDQQSQQNRQNSKRVNTEKEVEDFIRENEQTSYEVSILAHVKEIKDDGILISSDTDEFPGVFFITGVRDAMIDEEFWKLKAGVSFRILMEDMKRENVKYNIPEYRAKEMIILYDEETLARGDILLTAAPQLKLSNPLSSTYNSFAISSGNYSWTAEENGLEKQTSAFETNPLQESNYQKKLKLPNYPADDILISSSYSMNVQPDIFTVRQWDIADMNHSEAKEEKITVYYGRVNYIDLQKDKIYEFTAEWTKDNFPENKYYGTASYVAATE